MLDKLQFNNMVITNAKVIQKVRIQIVRKIIARIRKLTKLLEKRPEDSKTIVKQRKCVAIVQQAKKLKRDDIMRKIFLLQKQPDKIVTNSQSTPQEVVIALFAVNKAIKDIVKRFREQLNYIEEEAESWKNTLLEIGKQKEQKKRRKKRAEKYAKNNEKKPKNNVKETDSVELKETKTKRRNESLKLTKNIETEGDGESSHGSDFDDDGESSHGSHLDDDGESSHGSDLDDDAESSHGSDFDDDGESSHGSDFNDNEDVTQELNFNEDEESDFIEEEEKTKLMKTKQNQIPMVNEKVLNDTTMGSIKGDINKNSKKIQKSQTTEETNEETNQEQIKYMSGYSRMKIPHQKKAKEKPKRVGVVDPFFITETGEPFIANIELPYDEDEDEEIDNSVKQEEKFQKRNQKFNRPDRDRNSNSKKFNRPDRERNSNSKKFQSQRVEKKPKYEDLHPSWQAKKKQSGIANFQGKKIKFDEEESTQKPPMRNISKEPEKSDLHPSWIAKQKLKPTIAPFQGKKIKFDDSE